MYNSGTTEQPGTASHIARFPGTVSRASAPRSGPDAAPEPGTASGAGGAGVGVAPEPGTTPTPANGADGSATPSGPDAAPEPGTVSGAGDADPRTRVLFSSRPHLWGVGLPRYLF